MSATDEALRAVHNVMRREGEPKVELARRMYDASRQVYEAHGSGTLKSWRDLPEGSKQHWLKRARLKR